MFIFVRKTLNCRDLGTCLNGLTTLWLQRCSLYDLDGISCFNSLKVTSILSLNSAEKFSKSVWCGLLPYAMESIKSLALMESYTYHQLPGNLPMQMINWLSSNGRSAGYSLVYCDAKSANFAVYHAMYLEPLFCMLYFQKCQMKKPLMLSCCLFLNDPRCTSDSVQYFSWLSC